jgi:hypothetical protein
MAKQEKFNRMNVIDKLKRRFPLNNPESWDKVSDKRLKEWEQEYLNEQKQIQERKEAEDKLLRKLAQDMTEMQSEMVASLAFNALLTDGAQHKQWYLERILKVVKTDEGIEKMRNYSAEKKDYAYSWEEGTPP